MIFSDPITEKLQDLLAREKPLLERGHFSTEQFIFMLSKLSAASWGPAQQSIAPDDFESVKNLLATGQNLETFVSLSKTLGFLTKEKEDTLRFADLQLRDTLASREFIKFLSGEYSDRGYMRDEAAKALGQIGEPAIPFLLDALGHKDDAVSLGAAVVLRKMGPPVVPALVRSLQFGNRRIRRWIMEALSSADNAYAALPQLIDIVYHEDQTLVRAGAVIALGKTRDEKAEKALIAALDVNNTMIRSLAESALKAFNTPRARRALDDYRRRGRVKDHKGTVKPSPPVQSKPARETIRVFISYPREEASLVLQIRRLLKLAGFDPWIDSEGLLAGEDWESRLFDALRASDFVIGVLSRHTPGGYQEKELQIALENIPVGRHADIPFVLPCVTDAVYKDYGNAIPEYLKQHHVIDFKDLREGWKALHRSLCQAAQHAGLTVPFFLRSTPAFDLNQAAISKMIVEHGFFNSQFNREGNAPSLGPGFISSNIIEDTATGRVWTRGCIPVSKLPKAPMPTAEEEIAELTPPDQRTTEAATLVEGRRQMVLTMKKTIREWLDLFNKERVDGYNHWRLPTVEEAMSLMTREVQAHGLHISHHFSDHDCIRTSDTHLHPFGITGQPEYGNRTVWVVCYRTAECLEVPEEAPVPLRFVCTAWDH